MAEQNTVKPAINKVEKGHLKLTLEKQVSFFKKKSCLV